MRIAAGTVTYCGYEDRDANGTRLDVYREVLAKANSMNADLVSMPAGYLRASSESERDHLANQLVNHAKRFGVGVAVGVDLAEKRLPQDFSSLIRDCALPYFAIAWSPKEGVTHCWR